MQNDILKFFSASHCLQTKNLGKISYLKIKINPWRKLKIIWPAMKKNVLHSVVQFRRNFSQF
jgi:hypothetical protein